MSRERLKDTYILVVDDDDDIRTSFELALKMEGATTAVAGDGSAAITQCHDNEFDAVVLDMMLPKASGFVVLEKITQLEDPPVVIMVTANQGKRHMAYAEALGVHAYLNKPVSLQNLVDTLVDLLEQQDALANDE